MSQAHSPQQTGAPQRNSSDWGVVRKPRSSSAQDPPEYHSEGKQGQQEKHDPTGSRLGTVDKNSEHGAIGLHDVPEELHSLHSGSIARLGQFTPRLSPKVDPWLPIDLLGSRDRKLRSYRQRSLPPVRNRASQTGIIENGLHTSSSYPNSL